MRKLIVLLIGISAAAALAAQTFVGSRDEPESDRITQRTLECDGTLPNGCEVRCTVPEGVLVFLQADVQRVFVSGSASHTLIQVQQRLPGGISSVLVGGFTNCDLNGLRDPSLGRFAQTDAP